IHLPGMNGFELCRRLQEQGIELPVIFMSAHTDAAWSAAAHDAGAIAFITKPFRGQVLLTAIVDAINSRSGGRACNSADGNRLCQPVPTDLGPALAAKPGGRTCKLSRMAFSMPQQIREQRARHDAPWLH